MFFPMVQWVCLKAWVSRVPIQGSKIKHCVIDMGRRLRLTFGLSFFFMVFFSYYTQWTFFLRFFFFFFITIFFFVVFFLFGMGISLGIFCKSKTSSTCENSHFNLSLFTPSSNSTPFHALQKVKTALLATTL